MATKTLHQRLFLEAILILICFSLCCLLYQVGTYRLVVLNLFFLPVVLSAFFLGRYSAGILALLCVVCASVVTVATTLHSHSYVTYTPPLVIDLILTIWGAVLGITSILVGTLSDASTRRIDELHDAYLGVMEVLTQYLNSGDPKLRNRATKLSELSRHVAARMKLSDAEIDNIRVAALLQDIENIEVTARVIRKAVGALSYESQKKQLEHTFSGSDLIRSLGSVLTGALPLLVDYGDCLQTSETKDGIPVPVEPALGTKIISTVRRYLTLVSQEPCLAKPRQAINALKNDLNCDYHPAIIHALKQVVLHSADTDPVNELETLSAANKCISVLIAASSSKCEESSCGGAIVMEAETGKDQETAPENVGAATSDSG